MQQSFVQPGFVELCHVLFIMAEWIRAQTNHLLLKQFILSFFSFLSLSPHFWCTDWPCSHNCTDYVSGKHNLVCNDWFTNGPWKGPSKWWWGIFVFKTICHSTNCQKQRTVFWLVWLRWSGKAASPVFDVTEHQCEDCGKNCCHWNGLKFFVDALHCHNPCRPQLWRHWKLNPIDAVLWVREQ